MPTHIPWINLIHRKRIQLLTKTIEPAIIATKFIKRMNFLLENTWINFLPIRAPIPAPIGINPVKRLFAV
jgi:hypothetical protein